jgi:ClpX C4-type zinc finger
MTQRKHFKRLVRSRAAVTGQSYAAALRSIRQHRPEDRMPTTETTETTGNPITSCSFCDKPSTAVEKLVAGPAVYICNKCVDLSAAIISDAAHSTPEESARRRAQFASPSAEEILTLLPNVARLAARVEADLARKVGQLREQGTGWPQIAEALGMSTDAARQRFDK